MWNSLSLLIFHHWYSFSLYQSLHPSPPLNSPEMAEAAVTCLLERVSKLVTHLKVAWAANELRQLMDDLDSFKALLRVLASKQNDNTFFLREIERQIKEVVYDLEDTIYASFTYKSSRYSAIFITRPEWRKRSSILEKRSWCQCSRQWEGTFFILPSDSPRLLPHARKKYGLSLER